MAEDRTDTIHDDDLADEALDRVEMTKFTLSMSNFPGTTPPSVTKGG